MKYRPEIDGLRALAVLGVILFHTDISFLSGGYLGVDIFFVISGYLITKIIYSEVDKTGKFRFLRFYKRRILRLIPSLLVSIFCSVVLAFFLLPPEDIINFSKSLLSAVFSVSNIYFWSGSGYFDTNANFKPLLHTWSLGVEEQFYLIWPLIALFFFRHIKNAHLSLFLVTAGILICSGINTVFIDGFSYLFGGLFSNGPSTVFFLTPFRAVQFLIGISIALSERHDTPRQPNLLVQSLLSLIGITIIIVSFLTYSENMYSKAYSPYFSVLCSLIPCLGAGLVLFSKAPTFINVKVLSQPLIKNIGVISYALYLVHWPIIVFYKTAFALDKSMGIIDRFTVIALCFICAILLHKYIEQPFRISNNKKIFQLAPKTGFIFIGCSLVLSAVVFAVFQTSNGLTWRVHNYQPFDTAISLEPCSEENLIGCSFGYSGEHKNEIALIGDSLAMHYIAGLDYVFRQQETGADLYTASGCLVLPDTLSRRSSDKCKKLRKTINKVFSSGEYKNVILAQHWRRYTDTDKSQLVGEENVHGITEKELQTHLETRLTSFIKELSRYDRKIFLVDSFQIPSAINTVRCLHSPFKNPERCEIPEFDFEQISQKRSLTTAVLKKVANSNKNVFYIDPLNAFCDHSAKTCRPVIENGDLYFVDTIHYTKAGSTLVASNISSLICDDLHD